MKTHIEWTQLQQALQAARITVWRDTADLWPGEDWRTKIRRAITDNALVFIACFSRASLARSKSYQNEELMLAIEQMRLRRLDEVWLIPLRFDECEIPDWDIGGGRTLTSIQRVDLFDDKTREGSERLIGSILRILGQPTQGERIRDQPAVPLGLKEGSRKKQNNSVFIVYRMDNMDSREMRVSFERSIQEIDSDILVLDGEVSQRGIPWANEVRKRLSRSRLLIVDVTRPSREVMFEFGFGGNKPFIPVIHRPDDRDGLPAWLTEFQTSSFHETGLPRLAAEVVTMLRTTLPKSNAYRRPLPVPGLVIWLESCGTTRFGDAYQRVTNLAQRYSLKVEQVDPKDLLSFDDLRRLLRAWMVIACMDGGSSDYASHFFLGDVAARRRAGSGNGRGQFLERRGVALIPAGQELSLLVADSARRVRREILTTVSVENILKAVEPAFATYRRWLLSDV